jgi:hypothetical protein
LIITIQGVGTSPEIDFADERRSDIARRDAPRVMRTLRATLVFADGARIDCVVNDVSATGAGLACLTAVLPETRLSIDLPGIGVISGHAVWVSGIRIGMAFDERINPAAIVVLPKKPATIDRRAE